MSSEKEVNYGAAGPPKKVPCKKGAISNDERQFIRENKKMMSAKEIAHHLNRNEIFVKRYMGRQIGDDTLKEPQDVKFEIKTKIQNQQSWKALKSELTDDEFEHFSEVYTSVMEQLKGNYTATEELSVIQFAKLQVLMSRELRMHKSIQQTIHQLENELTSFGPDEDLDSEQRVRKSQVRDLLADYRNGAAAGYKNFLDIQARHSAIEKSLKASREQRINKIDQVNVSWIDVIKRLYDDEQRDLDGVSMAIGKKAYDKEFDRLGTPHTFTNDTVEQPLLNSETYNESNQPNLEENTGSKSSDQEDNGD